MAGCGWARTARLLAYACCWGAAPLDEQDTMAVLHWWSLLCGVVTDGDAAVGRLPRLFFWTVPGGLLGWLDDLLIPRGAGAEH